MLVGLACAWLMLLLAVEVVAVLKYGWTISALLCICLATVVYLGIFGFIGWWAVVLGGAYLILHGFVACIDGRVLFCAASWFFGAVLLLE